MRFLPNLLPGVDSFTEFLGMAGMLRDPHAIQNIYRIEDGLLHAEVTANMLRHLRSFPDVASLIDERYLRGSPPDIHSLRKLPDRTLGRELARHIDTYNFDPAYYQQLPPETDITPDLRLAINRIRETHDIWHIVLGFHPTPVGETGQKAFELAQLHRPMAGIIVAGAILRYSVVGGKQFEEVLSTIFAGLQMGQAAKPLLAQKWELMWDHPIDQIRQNLNIHLPTPFELGALDPLGVKPSHRE